MSYSIRFFFLFFILYACAAQAPPTGGKKDTTPPLLIQSIPPIESTLFKRNKIILFFNERVKLVNPSKEIFITPFVKKIQYFAKKNNITILLEEVLKENFTYILNFGDAIQDITEGNKARQIIFTFTTGEVLDTLQLGGEVKDMLTQKPLINATLMLYQSNNDTISVEKNLPIYVVNTDSAGVFQFNYIKKGNYNLYAILEKNRNFIFDNPKNEKIAFIENIELDTIKKYFYLYPQTYDFSKPTLLNKNITDSYIQLIYNKNLYDYKVLSSDSTILSAVFLKNNILTLYNYPEMRDKKTLFIEAKDSLSQKRKDTIKINFPNLAKIVSNEKWELSIDNMDRYKVENTFFSFSINFNKPVMSFDSTKIFQLIKIDSTTTRYDTIYKIQKKEEMGVPIDDRIIEKLQAMEMLQIDILKIVEQRKKFIPSLEIQEKVSQILENHQNKKEEKNDLYEFLELRRKNLIFYKNTLSDSFNIDTVKNNIVSYDTLASTLVFSWKNKKKQCKIDSLYAIKNMILACDSMAFISIEKDTSSVFNTHFSVVEKEKTATVAGRVLTEKKVGLIVELLNEKYESIGVRYSPFFSFSGIMPQKVLLRVIVDENNNKKWDKGNYIEKTYPEQVYFYPQKISLKANWEIQDLVIDLSKTQK